MTFVAPNTTFCENTPENWRLFHHLKAALLNPQSRRFGRSSGESLKAALQRREAAENKQLRSLRAFLPGHEPDRHPL